MPGEPSPTRAIADGSRPALPTAVKHGVAHAAGGVFRALLRFGGDAQPREGAAKIVDHADLDVGPPEIDAGKEGRLGLIARVELAFVRHRRGCIEGTNRMCSDGLPLS